MNILTIVSNPEPGTGYWVRLFIFISFVLLLAFKSKLKSETVEVSEIENEKELPHVDGKDDCIVAADPVSHTIILVYVVGYYADVKYKINGFLKTVHNIHSFSKIYVGRKLEITYFIFFKFKIIFEEKLIEQKLI